MGADQLLFGVTYTARQITSRATSGDRPGVPTADTPPRPRLFDHQEPGDQLVAAHAELERPTWRSLPFPGDLVDTTPDGPVCAQA